MCAERKDEEAIFYVALELKSPAERSAYLKGVCGDNLDLLARVEALLKVHDSEQSIVEAAASSLDMTLGTETLAEGPGTRIGRYKLLQLIGEGGFGVVYMAQQEEPIRRKIALKIIKLGMDTKQVIARFEAERQALAMMEHPNIAKVLDAGATDTGRPYFVMELVKGIAITEYCDKNNLDTRQRLELFIEVCKAVQHAHQKGIIHRDIKPSNVMITLRDDDTPVPKIIDFGIAKATEARLTEKTLFTEFKQFIGTPEYMSPEQARMGELDVDTRSDIYSLGVLLYELLTGTTPFDGEKLRSSAYDEMLRTIREAEPPKPSTRLNTLGDALSDVAKHRDVQPSELCKIIQGDLDWIVLKTLEKDRTRRYETANELAMDIERHLADEPVVAGPPSTVYRVRKFVRRNRMLVTSVAVVLVVLVGGIVASTIFAVGQARARTEAVAAKDQADQARNIAEVARTAEAKHRQIAELERDRSATNFQMAREAVDELTRVADERLSRVPKVSHIRRQLLERVRVFYEGFLEEKSDDPAICEEIGQAYMRLGDIHGALGEYEQCEQALRQAISIFERLSNDFPNCHQHRLSLALALWDLGVLFKNAIRDKEEALKMYRRSFELRAELVEEFPNEPAYVSDLAWSHVDLGLVLSDLGRYQEAIPELRRALFLRKQLVARFPNVVAYRDELAHSYHWLGSQLLISGELTEAEQELRQALELREQLFAEDLDSPMTRGNLAHIKYYLGKLLTKQGKAEEAEKEYRETIVIWEKLLAEFPGDVEHRRHLGDALRDLSEALIDSGRSEEAEDALRQAIAHREKLAIDLPDVAGFQSNLAHCLAKLGQMLSETGRLEEADQAHRKALTLREKLVSNFPDVPKYKARLAESYSSLGDVLKAGGQLEEAEEAYQKAEEMEKEVVPEAER